METIPTQGNPDEEQIKNKRLKRILGVAKLFAPSFYWQQLEESIQDMNFKSSLDCAWFSAKTVAGVIGEGIRIAANPWLLFGEACFFALPIVVRAPRLPVVPIFVILAILLGFLRFRDAYSYPSAGSAAEMVKDAGMAVVLVITCELTFASFAPSLALLSVTRSFQAAIGGFMAAQWRVLYHREDPPDPIRRELVKRKVATVHMHLLLMAAVSPLLASSVEAVPSPSHLVQSFLLVMTPIVIALAWKLKKNHWVYLIDRMPFSIKEDPVLRELTRQRNLLPVWDGVGKFRKDLYMEGALFMLLAYLPAVAVWRWITNSPLLAHVDFLQIGVNFLALVLLSLIWLRVKKLNVRLAEDLDTAIEARKAELAAEPAVCYATA